SPAIIVTADDPDLQVTINGERIRDLQVRGPAFNMVSLPPGKYDVAVRCGPTRQLELVSMADWQQSRTFPGGASEDRFDVKLQRRQRVTLVIKTSPKAAEQPVWTKLFNGKNFDGWQIPFPLAPGNEWRVHDDVIIGSGRRSYIFTKSANYADFHLRVVAKI